ncbi:MAG: cellulose-binding protein [Bacteroidetes bacterium]|nr:MAG: cellulose-binding protein [Bacteroidota bacterium]
MNFLKEFSYFCFGFMLIMALNCGKDDPIPNPVAAPLTSTIDLETTYQTIAGFGGANRMWGTQFLKPEDAPTAFGMGPNQLGLSIFRVRIASNPDEWPLILESVTQAQNFGVKILASPWSPPAALKNNNSEIGGYLLPENYEAFKDHINDFVAYMNQNGIDIYAISIQNEPDIQVSYESCDWSSNQMIDFIVNYGHLINNTKIAAPESFKFDPWYTNPFLQNSECRNNLDIVAGHIYGSGLGAFPLAEEHNKEIWMTEYLLNLNTGNAGATPWASHEESTKWNESMNMLETIHEAMEFNWNAYIWWYLQRYYSFLGDGTENTVNGDMLKRGYAFSHYSKYIRPGFIRVGQSTNKENNLMITAYSSQDQIVAVIINPEDTDLINFNVAVPSVSGAKAYETSLVLDHEEKTASVSEGKVAVDLGGNSITTVIIEK